MNLFSVTTACLLINLVFLSKSYAWDLKTLDSHLPHCTRQNAIESSSPETLTQSLTPFLTHHRVLILREKEGNILVLFDRYAQENKQGPCLQHTLFFGKERRFYQLPNPSVLHRISKTTEVLLEEKFEPSKVKLGVVLPLDHFDFDMISSGKDTFLSTYPVSEPNSIRWLSEKPGQEKIEVICGEHSFTFQAVPPQQSNLVLTQAQFIPLSQKRKPVYYIRFQTAKQKTIDVYVDQPAFSGHNQKPFRLFIGYPGQMEEQEIIGVQDSRPQDGDLTLTTKKGDIFRTPLTGRLPGELQNRELFHWIVQGVPYTQAKPMEFTEENLKHLRIPGTPSKDSHQPIIPCF